MPPATPGLSRPLAGAQTVGDGRPRRLVRLRSVGPRARPCPRRSRPRPPGAAAAEVAHVARLDGREAPVQPARVGRRVHDPRCTISTERRECAATALATLPRRTPPRPLRPWEPSTIRRASCSSASSAMPFQVGARFDLGALGAEARGLGERRARGGGLLRPPPERRRSAPRRTASAGGQEPDVERLPHGDDERLAAASRAGGPPPRSPAWPGQSRRRRRRRDRVPWTPLMSSPSASASAPSRCAFADAARRGGECHAGPSPCRNRRVAASAGRAPPSR